MAVPCLYLFVVSYWEYMSVRVLGAATTLCPDPSHCVTLWRETGWRGLQDRFWICRQVWPPTTPAVSCNGFPVSGICAGPAVRHGRAVPAAHHSSCLTAGHLPRTAAATAPPRCLASSHCCAAFPHYGWLSLLSHLISQFYLSYIQCQFSADRCYCS